MRKQHSGFSLIELLVSMTIFTVVVTITTGSLIVLIDSNTRAQSIQSAVGNLTFALDSMTREIRTGTFYFCRNYNQPPVVGQNTTSVSNCLTGGNYLSIIEGGDSLTGGRISYYYDDDHYGEGHGAVLRRLAASGNNWQAITSENVRITEMEFVVTRTNPNDLRQPSVTVYIAGEAGDIPGSESDFAIQTTVVQRTLDI